LSTATIIFIGVGFYIVLMVAIGVYASGKTHTVNEFIVAGRGLPVWLCSTTIVATWFGGGTMMGASGAAYDNGMLGVAQCSSPSVSFSRP
jgi:Na+/proline symporter